MILSRQNLQQLFRYAMSLCHDQHSAEDLVQSALERWLPLQAHTDNPMAYLRRSIRNQFIDQCRRQQVIAFDPLEDDSLSLLDCDSLESLIIDSDQVEKILAQLNAAEREVLYLWAVEGFSAREIAEQLQLARGTVLSRLYRLREKVQQFSHPDYSSSEHSHTRGRPQ